MMSDQPQKSSKRKTNDDWPSFLQKTNAVCSLYYRQWKFWAAIIFGSIYFIPGIYFNLDHKLQNAGPDQIPYKLDNSVPLVVGSSFEEKLISGFDFGELSQFKPMLIRQLAGKVIVAPDRLNEQERKEVFEKLLASDQIKTVYLSPGVNGVNGHIDRDAMLSMLQHCFDFRNQTGFQGTIKPLLQIPLVDGLWFLLAYMGGMACMYFCSIGMAPMKSPVCRMMPNMVVPHLLIPGLFLFFWYSFVAFTFYQPWFQLGSYLTFLLSPFSCLALYLFFLRVKRPQDIHPILDMFKLICAIVFLSMFIMSMFKNGIWVSAFMLGYLPWVSEVALIVSLVLFCCLVWLVLQLCKSMSFSKSFEEMISESKEQKIAADTKSEITSDKMLSEKIKILKTFSTFKSRAGLLHASEGQHAILLRRAVIALLSILVVMVFGIGFEFMKNEQVAKTLSFIFKSMLVGGAGLVFSFLIRNQSRLGTMPCYTLLPITKTELRKVIFRGKASDFIFWVGLFTLSLIALCLLSQNLKIRSLTYFLSAELALLGICIVIFAFSIWKTMIGDYFDGKASLFILFFLPFWIIFPLFMAVVYNWDFSNYQLHLTIGLELLVPGVFLIWRAWSLWLEWEWGYVPEMNSLID